MQEILVLRKTACEWTDGATSLYNGIASLHFSLAYLSSTILDNLLRALSWLAGCLALTMPDSNLTRAAFIDRVLTSRLPGEVAKRFLFADGEVAALYTLGRKALDGLPQPVVLFVATFPPTRTSVGVHDFGIDYCEQPVVSAAEASELLAQFDQPQAAIFRAKCRVPSV